MFFALQFDSPGPVGPAAAAAMTAVVVVLEDDEAVGSEGDPQARKFDAIDAGGVPRSRHPCR